MVHCSFLTGLESSHCRDEEASFCNHDDYLVLYGIPEEELFRRVSVVLWILLHSSSHVSLAGHGGDERTAH